MSERMLNMGLGFNLFSGEHSKRYMHGQEDTFIAFKYLKVEYKLSP